MPEPIDMGVAPNPIEQKMLNAMLKTNALLENMSRKEEKDDDDKGAEKIAKVMKSELDKCSPRLYMLMPENKETKENLSKASAPLAPKVDAPQAPDLDDLMKEVEEILGNDLKLWF